MFSENRFDGAQNTQEVAVPVEKKETLTEPELRQREAELKTRYEGPYRKEQAEKFRNERSWLRTKEQKEIEKIKTRLSSIQTSTDQLKEGESSSLLRSNDYLAGQLRVAEEQRAVLEQKKKERGVFQKLKYALVQDPLKEAMGSISQIEAKHKAEIEANFKQVEEIEAKWDAYKEKQTVTNARVMEETVSSFKGDRADIQKRLRGVNQSSRDAVRNTFLSMEQGNLDIAKLAKENNALVVHTIPLDGWSMKTTSMNNTEVDVEKLTAKEKSDILITKQPDLSASILSAEEAIEGQDMFYPFGFILDGKMVAAYEGDEGTYADGDARRKKEQYSGTLQKDVPERFGVLSKIAAKKSQGGSYNEAIVHKPKLKAIILDEKTIKAENVIWKGRRGEYGDKVAEDYPMSERDSIYKRFGGTVENGGQITLEDDISAPPGILRIVRERTGMEKAFEYAKENHPDLPVYIRRPDGVYTQDGKKVTAEEIYS